MFDSVDFHLIDHLECCLKAEELQEKSDKIMKTLDEKMKDFDLSKSESNENSKVLSPLPLFHSYALNLSVLGILAAGASEFLLPKFSPMDIFNKTKKEKFNFLPGVPTMFHYLLST